MLGIVSIFTYGIGKGKKRLEEANVRNVSLTNFDVIAKEAAAQGYVKESDIEGLIAFRDSLG